MDGTLTVRQPTLFLDLALAPQGTPPPDDSTLPGRSQVEQVLIDRALQPFLGEVKTQREQEVETVERHLEISLNWTRGARNSRKNAVARSPIFNITDRLGRYLTQNAPRQKLLRLLVMKKLSGLPDKRRGPTASCAIALF